MKEYKLVWSTFSGLGWVHSFHQPSLKMAREYARRVCASLPVGSYLHLWDADFDRHYGVWGRSVSQPAVELDLRPYSPLS